MQQDGEVPGSESIQKSWSSGTVGFGTGPEGFRLDMHFGWCARATGAMEASNGMSHSALALAAVIIAVPAR